MVNKPYVPKLILIVYSGKKDSEDHDGWTNLAITSIKIKGGPLVEFPTHHTCPFPARETTEYKKWRFFIDNPLSFSLENSSRH